ncbi:MAG: GDSL-type esterase/lipase family protein [Bacteroidia bacterium]
MKSEGDKNKLINSTALAPFYEKLSTLDSTEEGTVSIVHIGDSHIQADILSGTVRQNIQERFGHAGRGFVFPYKIAATTGVYDVRFSYDGTWKKASVMKNYTEAHLGLAGYSVSPSHSSNFVLRLKNAEETDDYFNYVSFLGSNACFYPELLDSTFIVEGHEVAFREIQDSVVFRPKTDSNSNMELQGIVLKNGCSGVLYHSAGVNGSSTLQYLRSDGFENQIAELDADLVIVSFGTNDCYVPSRSFCEHCVKERYQQIISRIRSKNPMVSILLTAPTDHYYYRKYSNPNIPKLVKVLHEVSVEEKVALWDLYDIMGGKNSIVEWRNENLARRDLIHFTKEGYYKQGDMLYEAILKGYTER